MEFSGFDWDYGNFAKCQKHGVTIEVLESLFNRPVAILPDESHSQAERRFRAIGRTSEGRAIFVVFTLRRAGEDVLIRPIGARYMHEKEVKSYEEENPDI
ncbi:MAG: BrnT family toxin [Azospirillaceae bacterium]|nr:BrnT family toxin [Azospirillaceae bacterium]